MMNQDHNFEVVKTQVQHHWSAEWKHRGDACDSSVSSVKDDSSTEGTNRKKKKKDVALTLSNANARNNEVAIFCNF